MSKLDKTNSRKIKRGNCGEIVGKLWGKYLTNKKSQVLKMLPKIKKCAQFVIIKIFHKKGARSFVPRSPFDLFCSLSHHNTYQQ